MFPFNPDAELPEWQTMREQEANHDEDEGLGELEEMIDDDSLYDFLDDVFD